MDKFGKAAGNGGADPESGRWRLLARLGLGAYVTHEATAVWVVSALALAGLTGLAIPGDEVDAAPATVSGAIGADGVSDEMRDSHHLYRWQPALGQPALGIEVCSGFDEIVGAPDASALDDIADKTNAAVAAVNPAASAPDGADAAQMRIECLRRYRWQPILRDEFCGRLDEVVGQPNAPATETAGRDTCGLTDAGAKRGLVLCAVLFVLIAGTKVNIATPLSFPSRIFVIPAKAGIPKLRDKLQRESRPSWIPVPRLRSGFFGREVS